MMKMGHSSKLSLQCVTACLIVALSIFWGPSRNEQVAT